MLEIIVNFNTLTILPSKKLLIICYHMIFIKIKKKKKIKTTQESHQTYNKI